MAMSVAIMAKYVDARPGLKPGGYSPMNNRQDSGSTAVEQRRLGLRRESHYMEGHHGRA
jgi:hypothetical protein